MRRGVSHLLHLLHLLRDLEAAITGYGQCLRCHRSWRTTASVSVWHSPSSATFLLCMDCWADVVGEADPHAGLILQGYLQQYLDDIPLTSTFVMSDETKRDMLAAYGMAWRVGVEWRPQWRRPLMFDVRPMLRERRGQFDARQVVARPEVSRQIGRRFTEVIELGESATPADVDRIKDTWEAGRRSGLMEAGVYGGPHAAVVVETAIKLVDKAGDGHRILQPELSLLMRAVDGLNAYVSMSQTVEPDDVIEVPGWNGAGSDTEQGDMEVNRG